MESKLDRRYHYYEEMSKLIGVPLTNLFYCMCKRLARFFIMLIESAERTPEPKHLLRGMKKIVRSVIRRHIPVDVFLDRVLVHLKLRIPEEWRARVTCDLNSFYVGWDNKWAAQLAAAKGTKWYKLIDKPVPDTIK
jgi:hypothetical protein